MRIIAILLLLPLLCFPAEGRGEKRASSDPVKVSGEGIYYLEGKDNLDYARSMAIQTARANAIASKFGTAISSSVHSSADIGSGGEERNSFSSVMRSLQTGVWVKDLQAPEVVSFMDADGSFGFKASVKGLARQLKSSPVETRGRVLVEGARGLPPHEADRLREGEEFFFGFQAASDGWVAIYLADETGKVCRAAPASGAGYGLVPVTAGVDVTLRDERIRNEAYIADPAEQEAHNQVIYVFSPAPFTQPLASDTYTGRGLPTLSYDRFHEWLQDTALSDERLTVTWQTIRIHR